MINLKASPFKRSVMETLMLSPDTWTRRRDLCGIKIRDGGNTPSETFNSRANAINDMVRAGLLERSTGKHGAVLVRIRKDRKVEIAIDWELGLVELDNTRKLKLPESILEAKASDRELFNMVIAFWNHPSNLMPDIAPVDNMEVYTTDNGKFTFGVVHYV